MERLAALEAEVKADAEAQRARKAAALANVRDQRVAQTADREQLRTQNAARAGKAGQAGQLGQTGKTGKTGKKRPASPLPIDLPAERSGDGATYDGGDAGHLEGLGGALELAAKANRVKQELSRAPKKGEKSWILSGLASLALGPVGWLYAGSLREAVPATAGWLALAALASKLLPVFLMMPVLMVILPLSGIAGVVYALQYNRKGSRQRLFDGDKDKQKQLRSG